MKQVWYEKYRPKTLDDYVFVDEKHKQLINKFIEEKSIPHLALYGHRGTGKTSLVHILKNEFGIDDFDFLERNASKYNSVDFIRDEVHSFVSTMASGPFKIVFLDECERLTPAAQDTLKAMTVDYMHNARFIFACNKIDKLIPELRSRVSEIQFQSLNKDDLLEKAAIILKKEKIKTTFETLEKYVDISYPDFRKLLVLLEDNSFNGKLEVEPKKNDNMFDIKAESLFYVEIGDWNAARKLLAENFSNEDYEELFEFYYTNLSTLDKFKDTNKWKAGIVLIAEYLYRNQFVADKEINFCALMIRLSEI